MSSLPAVRCVGSEAPVRFLDRLAALVTAVVKFLIVTVAVAIVGLAAVKLSPVVPSLALLGCGLIVVSPDFRAWVNTKANEFVRTAVISALQNGGQLVEEVAQEAAEAALVVTENIPIVGHYVCRAAHFCFPAAINVAINRLVAPIERSLGVPPRSFRAGAWLLAAVSAGFFVGLYRYVFW